MIFRRRPTYAEYSALVKRVAELEKLVIHIGEVHDSNRDILNKRHKATLSRLDDADCAMAWIIKTLQFLGRKPLPRNHSAKVVQLFSGNEPGGAA